MPWALYAMYISIQSHKRPCKGKLISILNAGLNASPAGQPVGFFFRTLRAFLVSASSRKFSAWRRTAAS